MKLENSSILLLTNSQYNQNDEWELFAVRFPMVSQQQN